MELLDNLKKKQDEEFDKGFVHEFVNDHNGTWRPLRGLWIEDVLAYIHNYGDQVRSETAEAVAREEREKRIREIEKDNDILSREHYMNLWGN